MLFCPVRRSPTTVQASPRERARLPREWIFSRRKCSKKNFSSRQELWATGPGTRALLQIFDWPCAVFRHCGKYRRQPACPCGPPACPFGRQLAPPSDVSPIRLPAHPAPVHFLAFLCLANGPTASAHLAVRLPVLACRRVAGCQPAPSVRTCQRGGRHFCIKKYNDHAQVRICSGRRKSMRGGQAA